MLIEESFLLNVGGVSGFGVEGSGFSHKKGVCSKLVGAQAEV